MHPSSALGSELSSRLESSMARNDREETLRVILALVKSQPMESDLLNQLDKTVRWKPFETLKTILTAWPKLNRSKPELLSILARASKSGWLSLLSSAEQEALSKLEFSEDVAHSLSRVWYPTDLKLIINVLERHSSSSNSDAVLLFAYACKELKTDHGLAIRSLEALLPKLPAKSDNLHRASIILAELLFSTMRASKALEILTPLMNHKTLGVTVNQLIYSFGHYSETFDNNIIVDAARKWEKALPPLAQDAFQKIETLDTTDSNDDLKIGFISRSFRTHPVGWMIAGLLVENKDDPCFVATIFDLNPHDDFIAKTIRAVCGDQSYIDLSGADDRQILASLQSRDLDILIDLEGHAVDNVMYLYRGLSGIRVVKWIGGLVNSTSLSFFHSIISDKYQSPMDSHIPYSETVQRLPDGYVTYTPPPYRVDIEPPPHLKNGFITFGCTNNAIKLNRTTFSVWSKILHAVPNSRLLLKDRGFDSDEIRRLAVLWMSEHGIDESRLTFSGSSDHQNQLGCHNLIDVCLDPIPYSGGLCTLEAVSMGTPVITLAGEVIAHRHSVSHLENIGVPELIANDWDEYICKAVSLARNSEQLQEYSKELRGKLMQSPLLNHKKFLADWTKIMREIRRSPARFEN